MTIREMLKCLNMVVSNERGWKWIGKLEYGTMALFELVCIRDRLLSAKCSSCCHNILGVNVNTYRINH